MLDLLTTVCSIPTAPFAEQRVLAYAADFVKRHRRLKLRRDAIGNCLIELPGTNKARNRPPRLVLVAHTDHPGLIARAMTDNRTLRADFHGGVKPSFFPGAKVRFFGEKDRQYTGRVIDATEATSEGGGGGGGGGRSGGGRTSTCRVRVSQPVPAGAFGMFDLAPARQVGRQFHSRACDDLAGVASALATLAALHDDPPAANTAVLLTRGEEEGFLGAIACVRDPTLLRPTDRILSIECSAEQPAAPQKGGVVLRVGDRSSIFNSALSGFIHTQAEVLAEADASFKFQRALMPGGTCEATVFDAWGYTAAACCVPLRNYHNMNPATGKIASESIDTGDWTAMVNLFIHLARHHPTFDGTATALKDRLTKRYETFAPLLRESVMRLS